MLSRSMGDDHIGIAILVGPMEINYFEINLFPHDLPEIGGSFEIPEEDYDELCRLVEMFRGRKDRLVEICADCTTFDGLMSDLRRFA